MNSSSTYASPSSEAHTSPTPDSDVPREEAASRTSRSSPVRPASRRRRSFAVVEVVVLTLIVLAVFATGVLIAG